MGGCCSGSSADTGSGSWTHVDECSSAEIGPDHGHRAVGLGRGAHFHVQRPEVAVRRGDAAIAPVPGLPGHLLVPFHPWRVVPPASHGVSRGPRYSGAACPFSIFAYMAFTFFGIPSQEFRLMG